GRFIAAIGSFDGAVTIAGTAGGRLFRLDLEDEIRPLTELPVPPRSGAEDAHAGITRIVFMHAGLAFAAYNRFSEGFVLRVIRRRVETLAALPDTTYFGLEVVRGFERDALFASTDDKVYESRDRGDALGDTWMLASRGLPKRPH